MELRGGMHGFYDDVLIAENRSCALPLNFPKAELSPILFITRHLARLLNAPLSKLLRTYDLDFCWILFD